MQIPPLQIENKLKKILLGSGLLGSPSVSSGLQVLFYVPKGLSYSLVNVGPMVSAYILCQSPWLSSGLIKSPKVVLSFSLRSFGLPFRFLLTLVFVGFLPSSSLLISLISCSSVSFSLLPSSSVFFGPSLFFFVCHVFCQDFNKSCEQQETNEFGEQQGDKQVG